jgi:type I restriction enzyme R subunit
VIRPDEKLFEAAITSWLVEDGGYRAVKFGNRPEFKADFDAALGLDTKELFAFIEETQPEEWSRVVKAHGGQEATARAKFARRIADQIDDHGTLDALRHGVSDQGIAIRLAFFRPAHGLTPDLVERYQRNRLTVTRQLPYEGAGRTLDTCLFVNGLPVATAELKNPITGQGTDHAVEQYRTDRDPANVTLGRRALVHFAVDPETVSMTTRLAGKDTVFLPFNRGRDGGTGNPPNPDGHRTAYLWEDVWSKDAWMDILARFINVERPERGTPAQKRSAEKVIFPRYHQWDAVLKLEADAKANGAGQSYLVQHSAGSGKSNTIAWTAHRLSTLHDVADRKVFDKVIVITDRVVLDRQLQDTVYQFEHVSGLVEKIDEDSAQLAAALAGERARIIITTLQKFPFVLDKVRELPNRRYAVIVDEAHSSMSGEAAKDLRLVLSGDSVEELTAAEAEDRGLVATPLDPVEEALAKAVGARGKQENLSFFAFTATPKAKTLELFGTWNVAEGKNEAFHLYTMRQAIEEGFILDVLAGYTTYHTGWRIAKAIADDPEYPERKARRAIGAFVALHPDTLADKAKIIVEHFRDRTAAKIAGQAKAMVVTSSRLHAVRHKQAIDRYTKDHGPGLGVLVAFSGTVSVADGEYTESKMNGFPESQTAARFNTPENRILIVAEKFQTGFDQPLLHTMYVDKTLVGLAAVQTLSRLNRIHNLKSDTFVLDFRNAAEEIQEAFEPYYAKTVAPPTDPNVLADSRRRLDDFDVLRVDEVELAIRLLVNVGPREHGQVYAALDPAIDRFKALNDEDRLAFKDALDKFVRTYSFVSQIVAYGDPRLERDYLYCRALAASISVGDTARLDLSRDVQLTHLKTELTFEDSIALTSEVGDVKSLFGDGTGLRNDPGMQHLSQIVEVLNERFGTNLNEQDQILFDQFEETWAADPVLADQAQSNTLDNFALAFKEKFVGTIAKRMNENEDIVKKILDDPDFAAELAGYYERKLYARLRTPSASSTPA